MTKTQGGVDGMNESLLAVAGVVIVALSVWVLVLITRADRAPLEQPTGGGYAPAPTMSDDVPDSYDPEDEPNEYTHFAGTVFHGGTAYEMWSREAVNHEDLKVQFSRDMPDRPFFFFSADFELVPVIQSDAPHVTEGK